MRSDISRSFCHVVGLANQEGLQRGGDKAAKSRRKKKELSPPPPRHESDEAWKEGEDSKVHLRSHSLFLNKWNSKAITNSKTQQGL